MARMLHFIGALLIVMTSLSDVISASKYTASVRVFVDKSAQDKYGKLTGKTSTSDFLKMMNSMYFEVNEIVKTLKPNGVDLELELDDIVLIGKDILNTNNGFISESSAGNQFHEWMEPKYSKNKYDLAVLYTGSDFGTTYGYAYVTGGVCTDKGVAVVSIQCTYMDALASAHEIGHVLGSGHDGSSPAYACRSNSGEIMNPTTFPQTPKHFFYSSCTAEQIKKNIAKRVGENNNCFSDSKKAIKGVRYGSLISPDGICKQAYGAKSYIARKRYHKYGDEVCVGLACMIRNTGSGWESKTQATPQGMICGQNKICIQGKCVKSDQGNPDVSDTCPFGEQPEVGDRKMKTCADMTAQSCKRFNASCCETCGDPGTADEVCKRLVDKDSALARLYYSGNYGDKLCSDFYCLTGYKAGSFLWNKFKAPEGMKCGQSKRCSKGKCVESMTGDALVSDTCPFGDQPYLGGQWKTTCQELTKKYGCSNKAWANTCCGSCGNTATADEICEKLEGQGSFLARLAYNNVYKDKLCQKLYCMQSKTSRNWRTHPTPDGMNCGQNRKCRKGSCDFTKAGDPNMSDDCPYGDSPYLNTGRQRGTCDDVIPDKSRCKYDNYWKSACCATCS